MKRKIIPDSSIKTKKDIIKETEFRLREMGKIEFKYPEPKDPSKRPLGARPVKLKLREGRTLFSEDVARELDYLYAFLYGLNIKQDLSNENMDKLREKIAKIKKNLGIKEPWEKL